MLLAKAGLVLSIILMAAGMAILLGSDEHNTLGDSLFFSGFGTCAVTVIWSIFAP